MVGIRANTCGFANAQGGSIFVGIYDNGNVTGLSDYRRLMDEIPNKLRDLMGILVDVNLHEQNGLHYLEVVTQPYAVPILLRGRYYFRSGSTKQELTGSALTDFLLRKSGKTWDDVTEPSATLADMDETSLTHFRNDAAKAGRLSNLEELSAAELLAKLRLTDNQGGLKRVAIILFGRDPGRFYRNLEVKMGRFGQTADELKYQEVEEGNLIQLLGAVPAQLNRKFFTRPIDFEGLQRVEAGEYPIAAVREMLLNAQVHRDYMGSTVQIRLYDNRFSIWNEGFLPEGLSLDALKRQHPSRPRNPVIADVCFKGGYIDAWGRGTLKIIHAAREAGLPEPELREQDGGMLVTLFKDRFADEQLQKYGLNERQVKAVQYVREHNAITNAQYQKLNQIGKSVATEELRQLVDKDLLMQTGKAGRGSKYVLLDQQP